MAEKSKSTPVLIAIGLYSLVKAVSLLLVAFGVHKLLGGNAGDMLHKWAQAVRVDPESRWAHLVISKVTGLSTGRMRELELGTLFYAGLFTVEGVGLVLRKRWAEYVAIISTVLFLPIEVIELYQHVSAVRIAVLVANVVMVVYLVWAVRRK